MAKDICISQRRSVYFSQLTTISKGETNMMVRAPMMSDCFLMRFSIGTPPQQTFAVPDTGCNVGLVISATIRIEKSICQYNLSYADGAMSTGFIAVESFTFEANDFIERTTLENIDFGCGTMNIDGSGLGAPGIIGLGNDRVSLIRQLNYPYFSYCVMDDRIDPRGWIHFGSAVRLLGRSMPITTHTSIYYLSIEGITVGGDDEEVNLLKEFFDYGFVIDSGISYTSLYNGAFDALIEKVKSMYDDEAE
ncbi:Aspartic proteinase nepenthesin-2 [Camellia lanceoleosa]|uniref:Aspartic proteinase nepenthesin-2 n=1 Tax=Camellia lanceoleosa TaxID=1840588 RepID=A0ACC0FN91_9ERIC|nr:Aspartic proteinase nepenthesin-2 [Camellia lanceoleosa]